MRIVLISLVLLHQVVARCDSDLLEKEKDREEDELLHGCRACKKVPVSSQACVEGFECDVSLPIAATVLPPSDNICETARCVEGKILANRQLTDKLHCHGKKWTIGDTETPVESAICAKSCGIEACKYAHPNATDDFYPLTVNAPDSANKCAFAKPCKYGFVALNSNGESDKDLGNAVDITCSSEGKWKIGLEKYEYVMCKMHSCTAPPPCPKLAAWSLTECSALFGNCKEAEVTDYAITCPPGSPRLSVVAADRSNTYASDRGAKCIEGKWMYNRGGILYPEDQIGGFKGPVTQVACH